MFQIKTFFEEKSTGENKKSKQAAKKETKIQHLSNNLESASFKLRRNIPTVKIDKKDKMDQFTSVLTRKRVCRFCGDTQTTQWRRGPDGKGIFSHLLIVYLKLQSKNTQ